MESKRILYAAPNTKVGRFHLPLLQNYGSCTFAGDSIRALKRMVKDNYDLLVIGDLNLSFFPGRDPLPLPDQLEDVTSGGMRESGQRDGRYISPQSH